MALVGSEAVYSWWLVTRCLPNLTAAHNACTMQHVLTGFALLLLLLPCTTADLCNPDAL
jgi:hypothetical protein